MCVSLSWLSLHREQPFAFVSRSAFIPQPGTYHVRHRLHDYTAKHDRFFFQWWNYLVYDSASQQQYQLMFQITHYSSRADTPGTYIVLAAKQQLSDGSDVTAGDMVPATRATISGDMDIHAPSSVAGWLSQYVQTAVDNDTYSVSGSFPASLTSSGEPLSFHLTFHRIHGLYTGLNNEADSVSKYCSLISNHFAYNSRVSGWWASSSESNVTFSASSSRYRAYAAASWGCQLPHTSTQPAISHPWTWLWLVVPAAEDGERPEISLCLGTARLEARSVGLGSLHGGVSVMGVGSELVGTAFAQAHHGTWHQLPLLWAASDGYLARFNYSVSQWANLSDTAGPYSVPLTQSYELLTRQWRLHVTFVSPASAFFRAPVTVEDVSSGQLRLFSDFRACNNRVQLTVLQRQWVAEADKESEVQEELLFEGEVAINAVEYAYEAELSDTVQATLRKLMPAGLFDEAAQLSQKVGGRDTDDS